MSGKVRIPFEKIEQAVRARKVGVLTNGTVWLDEAGDDLAGIIGRTCRKEVLLFAEHGYRGDGGPGSKISTIGRHNSYENYEARCLYGRGPQALKDLIDDLDMVVLGLPPDAGIRHDSFKRTTCHLMELASASHKPAVIVDFPNPVRGDIVEGNMPDPTYAQRSMTKWNMPYVWHPGPITLRHGLTNAELALMAKDCLKLDLDLDVIKVQGWRRDMWQDQTSLPYIVSEPTLATFTSHLGHITTGLFQGTPLSWGLGTAEPYCVLGAPWIDDDRLLNAVREHTLAGVTFSRAFFIPRWNEQGRSGVLWRRFYDQPCNGIRIHFMDRDALRIAHVQLVLLYEFLRLYPEEFDLDNDNDSFDKRLEDLQWSRRLKQAEGVDTILAEWREMSKKFSQIRKKYLLY